MDSASANMEALEKVGITAKVCQSNTTRKKGQEKRHSGRMDEPELCVAVKSKKRTQN